MEVKYEKLLARASLIIISAQLIYFAMRAAFPSLTIDDVKAMGTGSGLPAGLSGAFANLAGMLAKAQQTHHVITWMYLTLFGLQAVFALPMWYTYKKTPRKWKAGGLHFNNATTVMMLPGSAIWTIIYIVLVIIAARKWPPNHKRIKEKAYATQ